ncbi:hypothetical protein HEQ60_06535 [Haematospirillum sp. H1815]|uniref:hypothetical protein n=1 Tax=Haematospirillum sp. H1815 TaxID=2723108 RepID=UPI001438C57F|nr:hypothetical protein [Haematospirillum sp. H1815]NKD77416.1 hypothetical protein [Haematospirillum sp. H1815]
MVDLTQLRRMPTPNVLTAVNTFNKSLVVTAKLQETIQNQLNAKAAMIGDRYAASVSAKGLDRAKWARTEDSVRGAVDKIDYALQALTDIANTLPQMKYVVQKATADSVEKPENLKAYAQTLQSYIRSMDVSITSARGRTPLLDSQSGGLIYRTGITEGEQTEYGRDLSTRFSLEKDNIRWEADRASNSLIEYVDGKATKNSGLLTGGARLDAINTDGTVDFTIGASTASPQTMTGFTLKRSGLDVADSWFYEDLATEDGRARALKDIETARGTIAVQKTRIESMKITAEFYAQRAKAAIASIDADNIKTAEAQAAEIEKLKSEESLKAQVLLRSVMQSERLSQTYASILKIRDNPLLLKKKIRNAKIFDTILKVSI